MMLTNCREVSRRVASSEIASTRLARLSPPSASSWRCCLWTLTRAAWAAERIALTIINTRTASRPAELSALMSCCFALLTYRHHLPAGDTRGFAPGRPRRYDRMVRRALLPIRLLYDLFPRQ